MKHHVTAVFGWVRFSEIVPPEEMEESSFDLKSFQKLRLKWDDQEWFPRRATPKNVPPPCYYPDLIFPYHVMSAEGSGTR